MEKICKNCFNKLESKYCQECGQKSNTNRIDWHEISHDMIHSIWHIDKGFFYTFVQLIKRPGASISDYLAGRRVNYFKPFSYLLLTSAISLFVISFVLKITAPGTGSIPLETIRDNIEQQDQIIHQYEHTSIFVKTGVFVGSFVRKYLGFLLFGLTPILSLFSLLFFKNPRYNYWEHLAAAMYIISQINIVSILIILTDLGKIFNIHIANYSSKMNFGLIFIILVISFYYINLFPSGNKFYLVIKSLLVPIISFISALSLLSIFA